MVLAAEVEKLKSELAAANERQRKLEEELETARGKTSRAPAGDRSTEAPTTDEQPLLPDDQAALNAVMAAWATSTDLRAALVRASPVAQERFIAALRAEIDADS